MKYIVLVYCFLFSLTSYCQNTFNEMVDGLISKEVNAITVMELQEMLKAGQTTVLFDAREAEEFTISHLKGAQNCGYDSFNKKVLLNVSKSVSIVVYCSVGYRSDKIAKKLIALGYTNVNNLYGGIFDWVNSGYPVYSNKGKTNRIHGYNQKWGKWLRRGEKVF